jgi:energy-coupling factor transporter ATP-binding protein EcfA2
VRPLVSLRGVSFTYPDAATPALDGVTLEVRSGEVVAVAGRPGAGCSTLLLVAAAFAPRLTGGALRGERRLLAVRPGVVFATPWTQLTGLCYTALGEVAFGPASFGLPRQRVLGAAEAALRRLGVAHLKERDPATLSGGELQRVIVAAALSLEPDLLVLDDPAAELDPGAADALYAMLPELAAGGAAVLLASPDEERAARVANRAVLLEAGRVVRDGPPAVVLA